MFSPFNQTHVNTSHPLVFPACRRLWSPHVHVVPGFVLSRFRNVVVSHRLHRTRQFDTVTEWVPNVERQHVSLVVTYRPKFRSELEHSDVVKHRPKRCLVYLESDVVNSFCAGKNGNLVMKFVRTNELNDVSIVLRCWHECTRTEANDAEKVGEPLHISSA